MAVKICHCILIFHSSLTEQSTEILANNLNVCLCKLVWPFLAVYFGISGQMLHYVLIRKKNKESRLIDENTKCVGKSDVDVLQDMSARSCYSIFIELYLNVFYHAYLGAECVCVCVWGGGGSSIRYLIQLKIG